MLFIPLFSVEYGLIDVAYSAFPLSIIRFWVLHLSDCSLNRLYSIVKSEHEKLHPDLAPLGFVCDRNVFNGYSIVFLLRILSHLCPLVKKGLFLFLFLISQKNKYNFT